MSRSAYMDHNGDAADRSTIARRQLMKAGLGAGFAAAAVASGVASPTAAAAAADSSAAEVTEPTRGAVGADSSPVEITKPARLYAGPDMASWTTVVGDGLWVPDGQEPVNDDDLAALHLGGHTELLANVDRRPIMAHNITYLRVDGDEALRSRQLCSTEFRLPYVPTVDRIEENAETLEIALFTWDGSATRLDYGSAFQWKLNPWLDSFGDIRVWSADGTEWIDSGYRLSPDRGWHDFAMIVDHNRRTSVLQIDEMRFELPYSATPKAESWGTATESRFAIEAINAFPGTAFVGSTHRAQFRNWEWNWHL